ncbi:MAG: site-specific DNA-methyltransferase [Ardenticatenaceae bacterium]|nr:site-specific DNA-methyltransferase [Anaerolineales bacterium]MCB8922960.1 site-specific DNA-methyltransferase [Ardenticatenaceae bacterium]MCB8990307.1 site-specific DNA-methyltransferase [Ardenticatenaceae bacterium]
MREQLPRLDTHPELRQRLLPYCRLQPGEIWEDPVAGHRVGVLDAADETAVQTLMSGAKADLIINDPPYNLRVGQANTPHLSKQKLDDYMAFSRRWVENALAVTAVHAHFYIWLGADVRDQFQPLPDFMLLMRQYPALRPRNLITLRNQRGYGTQQNWMWVRQELLHYVQGKPPFHVVYTDIPKILRGYYKQVNGQRTENLQRSKAQTLRPGNVWVDVQQVFYRMKENVPGCYAQKPLKAIERLVQSSSDEGALLLDLFAHSGTTLLAAERYGRRVYTADNDPIFAEITIRRLEHYRASGEPGWQWHSPFPEISL